MYYVIMRIYLNMYSILIPKKNNVDWAMGIECLFLYNIYVFQLNHSEGSEGTICQGLLHTFL